MLDQTLVLGDDILSTNVVCVDYVSRLFVNLILDSFGDFSQTSPPSVYLQLSPLVHKIYLVCITKYKK